MPSNQPPAGPYPIPQSPALQAVRPTSLQDLFSKNPELLDRSELEEIVRQMQDLRERLAATATVRQVRIAKDKAPGIAAIPRIVSDPSDLGF